MLTKPQMREPVGTVLTAMKVHLVLENNFFSRVWQPRCVVNN